MKKKTILFVCVENACRSQMAEGFARNLLKDDFDIYSAGSKPAGSVNPDAVVVMNEVGIDISHRKPKGFVDLSQKAFDYVITMGCRDTCPFVAAQHHIDWEIKDPKGKSLESFRKVRDEIQTKVEDFIKNVNVK